MLSALTALFLTATAHFPDPAGLNCAELASHPDDPDRIAIGKETEQINLPEAIAACRKASAEPPFDARTAYHLGRVLYYSGLKQEAMPLLEASAEAGYRQSIFVLGYVISLGEAPREDKCRAAALWVRAASLGHPWSGYHLVKSSLDGSIVGCPATPAAETLPKYMELARANITVSASDGRVEALATRLSDNKKVEGKSHETLRFHERPLQIE